MTDNKALLVINAIVNKENIAEMPTYLGSVMPIFAQNGGKPLGRYKGIEQLTGEQGPEMVALIEFPSAEVIRELVNGDEFKALDELRGRVFSKLNLTICNEL